jgi:2-dehydro-3-deoxygluconokinase
MAEKVVRYTDIKPASSCRYDGVALGEVMLRLDPHDVPTACAREMRVFQGGGETNVACGLAYTFGLRTAVLTALVDDDIGKNIRNQLRAAGVDTSKIVWFNTKANGSRFSTDSKGTLMNGINFTYVGKGVIPSDTLYYRAHTAVRELREGDFDWDTLFGKEGVRVFSTGGIYTLISPTSSGLAIEAIRKANEHGTFVAADLNYRSKVEPNKKRAREINQQIAPHLGFLVGNDSDLADALGYESKVPAHASFEKWLEAYQGTVRHVAKDWPNLSLIGTQCYMTPRETRCTKPRCAPMSPLPIAPAAAIPSRRACWRRCSRARTWRQLCNGVRRMASWCKRRRATSRWWTRKPCWLK